MNAKVTVSLGASDRKCNLCMPGKGDFLAPKRNSLAGTLKNLD